jgi:hypothetical protein
MAGAIHGGRGGYKIPLPPARNVDDVLKNYEKIAAPQGAAIFFEIFENYA